MPPSRLPQSPRPTSSAYSDDSLTNSPRVVETDSAALTEGVGAEIAASLAPGDVVSVAGELGAGKTTLIRGACRALGIEDPIVSPTFTIGTRYCGRVPVSHLDLYRLETLDVEDPGLLDDYLRPDAIGFVEWPAVGDPRVDASVAVEIEHLGGDGRRITVADLRSAR
jgi:tRNA threonylcarbamoyladenosine biosynthesis protein TsaE